MNIRNYDIPAVVAANIFVFLYTALSKLADPEVFRVTMAGSGLLGGYAAVLSWLVPLVEIIVVLLLFFPFTRRAGLVAATALWALFTIYISVMMLTAARLPCSCGGIISTLSWPQHLLFNLLFLIVNGIALYRYKKFVATNRISRTPV